MSGNGLLAGLSVMAALARFFSYFTDCDSSPADKAASRIRHLIRSDIVRLVHPRLVPPQYSY